MLGKREKDGMLSFLDVLIDHRSDSLCFSVYREPTHTDLYVHGDSANPRHVFLGVARGLGIRALRLCSASTLRGERRHLRRVLRANRFDERTIARGLAQTTSRRRADAAATRRSLPYVPGVSDRLSSVLRGVGVATAMKPQRTLRSMLVKKKPAQAQVLGSVYRLNSGSCSWSYVGESTGGRCGNSTLTAPNPLDTPLRLATL